MEAICTDLVKRGPALGIILMLATQRPDAKSIPTGISANAVLRMCLKVMGQIENDMVLGTSASTSTASGPPCSAFEDKGVFYFAGEGLRPRIMRGQYIDGPAAKVIVARARVMREAAGRLTGYALGEDADQRGPLVRRRRADGVRRRRQAVVRDDRRPARRVDPRAPTPTSPRTPWRASSAPSASRSSRSARPARGRGRDASGPPSRRPRRRPMRSGGPGMRSATATRADLPGHAPRRYSRYTAAPP